MQSHARTHVVCMDAEWSGGAEVPQDEEKLDQWDYYVHFKDVRSAGADGGGHDGDGADGGGFIGDGDNDKQHIRGVVLSTVHCLSTELSLCNILLACTIAIITINSNSNSTNNNTSNNTITSTSTNINTINIITCSLTVEWMSG